jgi:hypothetical protein
MIRGEGPSRGCGTCWTYPFGIFAQRYLALLTTFPATQFAMLFAIRAALPSPVAPRTTTARLVAYLWPAREHTLAQATAPGL